MSNNIGFESRKFFDRQMQLFGNKGQQDISNSTVLIINLSPIHSELVKNLVLLGFNIDIIDSSNIDNNDLSTILFFSEEDKNLIGQDKSETIVKKLKEMNPFSKVNKINQEIKEIDFSKYKVIFNCPSNYNDIIDCNNALKSFDHILITSLSGFCVNYSFIEYRLNNVENKIRFLSDSNYVLTNDSEFLKNYQTGMKDTLSALNNRNNSFFVFDSILGSLLSQLMLSLLLEGVEVLKFNCVNYDMFGSQEFPLNSGTLNLLNF